MRPFIYERVDSPEFALAAFASAVPADADRQYLAGGTTLVDLMKLDVMRPQAVIDINALDRTAAGRIDAGAGGLRLGGMTRMAQAAGHPAVACVREGHARSDHEIREYMSGNLCRCAAYPNIVAAIRQAAPKIGRG